MLRDHRERDRIFKLDMALGEKATQSDVFNRCGKQLVDCLLSTSGDGSSGGCDGVVLLWWERHGQASHALRDLDELRLKDSMRTSGSGLTRTR